MALYKVQSPINSALQGMQNASATTAGMTKKQEVKEPKKSFGGALGSMIAGGSYGLGMADMFTGSEATKAMWGGVKGALGGGGAEAAGGIGGAAGADWKHASRNNRRRSSFSGKWGNGWRRRCITCRCGINGECRGRCRSKRGDYSGDGGGGRCIRRPGPWGGDFWRPEPWLASQATICREER